MDLVEEDYLNTALGILETTKPNKFDNLGNLPPPSNDLKDFNMKDYLKIMGRNNYANIINTISLGKEGSRDLFFNTSIAKGNLKDEMKQNINLDYAKKIYNIKNEEDIKEKINSDTWELMNFLFPPKDGQNSNTEDQAD